MTLIEILVVIAILSILAAAAMPLSRMTVKRTREVELRKNLRVLRNAIDAFHKDCIDKVLSSDHCKQDEYYYPESLELLTQPLDLKGSPDKKKRYLRRIPRDPMTPPAAPDDLNNWGLRSYTDDPESTQWGGGNVYDVFSKSDAAGLDGTNYSAW